MSETAVPEPSPSTLRTGSMFLRLLWMGSVPFLLLCAFILADRPAWTFGVGDLAFWGLAIVAIVARAIDVLVFHGLTADGAPATKRDAWRFAAVLLAASTLLWIGVQSVGT
jgi:hypothetical protein